MHTLYILAGPNGAGKTTYYFTALNKLFINQHLPFINLDVIAKDEMGGYSTENFVILNKKLLREAGISNTEKITIEVRKNAIILSSLTKRKPLNRNLSTLRKQIKEAIKQGQKPEKSVWGNRLREQEEKEWTW